MGDVETSTKGASRGRSRAVLDVLLGAVVAGVFALSFGLNVAYMDITLERIASDSMDVHADFDTFWRSAEALWRGEDLYDTGARLSNLNPPLWAIFISPFGLMEPLAAYRSFITLTTAVMVGYLAWMARELGVRGGWATIATGAFLVSSPFLASLALGQVYAFLTLGLVAAWSFDRRGMNVASGVALGLTIAIKPSLLPLVLWPLVRRRWDSLAATILAGGLSTLLAALVAGFGSTFVWLDLLRGSSADPFWDNGSLTGTAARLFTENPYVEPVATLPWLVPVAYVVGFVLLGLTVWRARLDPSMGLWAIVAASLLVSPISWHNYLMLLAPAILLLISRGYVLLALLLLALQTISPQWPLIWREEGTLLAALMLCLYFYILLLHWCALLPGGKSGTSEN